MLAKVLAILGYLLAEIYISSATDAQLKKISTYVCPHVDGFFPNPKYCSRFYYCRRNIPYDIPCPPFQFFHTPTKDCVYRTLTLKCGSLPMMPKTPNRNVLTSCDPLSCKLPDCFCSDDGTSNPGNFDPLVVPQMVILTFTGPLNDQHIESLSYLTNETNHNGCPFKATFFVSHEYTSYYYVQKLYELGHEIAAQSITNRLPKEFWKKASFEDWIEEVVGQKEILNKFSNVSKEDIFGMRAPFLRPGGNSMFEMISDFGFKYDSSLAAPLSRVPIWPYTLDHRPPHQCISQNCPHRSFPGIWEFPLNKYEIEGEVGITCFYMDQCLSKDKDVKVTRFFLDNFFRHYGTNKAPFVMNFHSNWIANKDNAYDLKYFLEFIKADRSVWIVTMQQALQWMRNPIKFYLAEDFEPWKCPRTLTTSCSLPQTCKVLMTDGSKIEERHYQICGMCPETYPWLNNIRGTKGRLSVKDLIEKATL